MFEPIVYEPPLHTVCVLVEAIELLIVKFNVAVESHPVELVVLYVYVPEDVYVVPFQE